MPLFIVHLQPEPSPVPQDIRLRRWLKEVKRRHGLRCVSVREAQGDEPMPTPGAAQDAPECEPGAAAQSVGANEGGAGPPLVGSSPTWTNAGSDWPWFDRV